MIERAYRGLFEFLTRPSQSASIINNIIKISSFVILSILLFFVMVPDNTKATELSLSEIITDNEGVKDKVTGQLQSAVSEGSTGRGEKIDIVATGYGDRRVVWTDSRCGTCHETNALFSHPVDVTPRMSVPGGLPLYRGQVVCTTCHENDNPSAHAEARGSDKNMLRMDLTPGQLCLECHDPLSGNRVDLHATALKQAHMSWSDSKYSQVNSLAVANDFGGEQIDSESQMCLSCHDGTVASAAGGGGGSGGSSFGGSFFSSSANHPIGIAYDTRKRDRESELQHQTMLDPRIRLFENRVGCNSCHSLFSRGDNHLVMSNYGSKLCLSCHKM